jgi:transposase
VGAFKKRAVEEGATIVFADEAGFNLLPSVVRTWAPVGEPPVLRTPCKYEHLSVASAVTSDGRVLSRIRDESFNGEAIVEFLEHVLRNVSGKVILIWDGASIHCCRAVKDFLSCGGCERLRLMRLPGYSPELNPDEHVWGWLKKELGNVCCLTLDELRYELRLKLRQLRRRSDLIFSFFDRAELTVADLQVKS